MSKLPAIATDLVEPTQLSVAGTVEKARKELLELLLENRCVESYIARRLLVDLGNGPDYSEVILVKNCETYRARIKTLISTLSDCAWPPTAPILDESAFSFDDDFVASDVVQNSSFVQITDEPVLISDNARVLMYQVHFLPVFLLEVADQVSDVPGSGVIVDMAYRSRIRQCRRQLVTARQRMIAANSGLVAFVAHKYKASTLSFDDLMQEGTVGLIKAVDRFDPERGLCFSTYAIYWIRQAISRLIVKQDKVVPLPVALAEKSSSVFEAMRDCYLRHERWPSAAELKNACGDLTEQEIKIISRYFQATHTLDSSHDDDDGMDVMDRMHQSQFSLPLDQLIESDLASYVGRAVASLPEKQATILAMRFGLKNHTEMTLQAVADQLNVTRERVRQIQNEALKKLKQQFGFDLMLFLEPNDG